MAAVAARPPSLRTRSMRAPLALGGLAVAALVAGLLDALSGRSGVEPLDALRLLVAPDGSADADLVQSVRLPRAVAGLACGAALGLAGALIQAVVRNPLAEPGTIGVANGAGLAIAVAGVAGLPLGALGSVPVAFAGGLLTAAIVIGVAGGLRADPVRLVLAGVAISFACAAGMTGLKILNEQWAFGMQLWSAGTVEQPGWGPVRALGWAIPVLGAISLLHARDLDALDLRDDAAAGLGVCAPAARGSQPAWSRCCSLRSPSHSPARSPSWGSPRPTWPTGWGCAATGSCCSAPRRPARRCCRWPTPPRCC
jgi:iron complex transport system permease protein